MDGPGRPSLYKPEFTEQAFELCLSGATNSDLADSFDVGHSTIDNWLRKHPEFAQAVKRGRDLADGKVARSLYARAIGYTYETTKVLLYRGEPVTVPHTVHLPPNVSAGMFWLCNRRPQQWRRGTRPAQDQTVGSSSGQAHDIRPAEGGVLYDAVPAPAERGEAGETLPEDRLGDGAGAGRPHLQLDGEAGMGPGRDVDAAEPVPGATGDDTLRHFAEIDARSAERSAGSAEKDDARHRLTQRAEAGEVKVDAAPSDGVATGQRQACFVTARQQSAVGALRKVTRRGVGSADIMSGGTAFFAPMTG